MALVDTVDWEVPRLANVSTSNPAEKSAADILAHRADERLKDYVSSALVVCLWIVGWASDVMAREFGWAVADFFVLPLGAARGLYFLIP